MKKFILLLALASAVNTGTAEAGWLEELAKATENPWDKSKRQAEERRNEIIIRSLQRREVPMADVSSYTTEPFDLSSTTVDPAYSGHNLGDLWTKINEILAPKGKFESTSDYEKRKSSISTAHLLGNLNINSAFVAKKTLLPSNVEYDADKQKMTVTVSSNDEVCNVKNKFQYTIYTDYRGKQEYSEYTGENGFGATTQIKKFVSSRVDLAGMNIKSKFEKGPDGIRRFRFEMPATPVEAQSLESNLATLIFFKPKTPYLGDVNWSYAPTRQDPIDVSLDRYMIYCDIEAIWLYNKSDGKILVKKSYA